MTFDGTRRVLAGRPEAGTAAGATDYTLTATDRDGDEAELTFNITIRAADAKPTTLSAATLGVNSTSTEDATVMLTSTVAWTTTTRTGQTLTLSYAENTAGASPKFAVTLTETQAGRVPDGMIPINNLEQLNTMRYDLTGDGQVGHVGDQSNMTDAGMAYAAAFPDVIWVSGRYTGYMLMWDLNFRNAGSYASGVVNTDWTEADGGNGWLPVGSDASNPFSGTFDGKGKKIDGLFINRTDDALRLGLFGYATGTIMNTGIQMQR
ncbi:MAG: hypothetical protein OXH57_09170 [Ekhidna sp.]|nr:hypothetical protein [Ekhidna sp.]